MAEMYRIGDFAEKVGVTPDWLKYYEKVGLIESQAAENGYRYYSFQQGAMIMSCLELKNLGFHTDEIVKLLKNGSFHDLMSTYSEKQAAIDQDICFSREMIRLLDYWKNAEHLFYEKDNWRICTMEGFYFMPTSNRNRFVDDKRTWPMRKEWNRWAPVIHSTQRIFIPEDYDTAIHHGPAQAQWGMSVSREFAEKMGVCVDEPAFYVPPQRCLEMFCRVKMTPSSLPEDKLLWPGTPANNSLPYVLPVLKAHNFRITGTCYSHRLVKLWENGVPVNYNVIYVPISS